MNFAPLAAISDGIIQKLNKTFDGEYTIYPEKVRQGLVRPCFFIKLLKPRVSKMVGETYLRENPYCIHFLPKVTNEPETECYAMLDRLYEVLEHIHVDGNLVRGIGMGGEIHDETLLFYVNYNVFVRRVYDPVLMEELELVNFKTSR